jgi:peptidoglycan hydrolase CwlO-like protein
MSDIVTTGLTVYEKAGITGFLIFLIFLLLALLLSVFSRNVKKYAEEAKIAKNESKIIQVQLTEQLRTLLAQCEDNCEAKDMVIRDKDSQISRLQMRVNELERKEIFMDNQIKTLETRITHLEMMK